LNAPSFYRVFVCAVGLLSPSLLLATSSHAHLASPGHTSPKPQITTTSLTGGTVGLAYSQTLAVAGGSAPYTWQIKSGSLPAGISLASYGTISGWPTAAGSSAFTVAVSDANGRSASTSLTLTVVAPPTITTTGLPGGIAGAAYSAAVQGTGGTAPYSWSIASGSLPPGLILASTTGLISGMPSGSGMYNLNTQMTDINGLSASKAFLMTIVAALNITAASLPSGSTGAAYNATLTASGGTTPYSWSVVSGQLPPGLALNTTSGIISGTPTAAGTYNVGVQVSDAGRQNASKIFSVLIGVGACISCQSPLTITSTSLPAGSINISYNATLTASGGTTPYTWSVSSGQLPVGITLASSGAISGTPTTAGSYGFTLQVADSAGHQISQAYTLSIGSPTGSLGILTNDLHLAYINQPYDAVLTASGGLAPYLWSVSSGQLPAGLSLNTITGHISGTPTQGGQFSVTLTARDALLAQGSKTLNLEVFEQPTDQYGGLTNLACPNGPQSHFYTQKIGSRWHLCDPAGYAYFMLGVSDVDAGDTSIADLGVSYRQAVTTKYGDPGPTWANQTIKRLLSWGFNTTVEEQSTYVYPFGRPTGSTIIPIAPLTLTSKYALTNIGSYAPDAIKSLVDCLNLSVYTGYSAGSAPDVFDPNFDAYVNSRNAATAADPYWSQWFTSPWVIGITFDDADELFGIGPGLEHPGPDGAVHPHTGWIALADSPTKTSSTKYNWTYQNSTVYSKQQLVNDLQKKYGTIAALNGAWGSSYTTFGSAGGWPKSTTGGTGLLDEDGSSAWLGDHDGTLRNAAAGVTTDLDAFLLEYWQKYFQIIHDRFKQYSPNELLISPALNAHAGLTRRQILQAAAQYCDVLAIAVSDQTLLDLSAGYTGDKPYSFEQLIMSANPDSSLWRYANPYGQTFTTQTDKANSYTSIVNFIGTAKVTATSTEPVVGATYWALADNWGEKANWGLVTFLDNAYDGQEAATSAGADSWGYRTGCLPGLPCEERNYGAFIPPVQNANLNVLRTVASGQ